MARCHTFTTMHSPHRIISPGVPEPQIVNSLRVRTKRIPKNISHIPIWAILPCERVHGSTIVLHVPAADLYVSLGRPQAVRSMTSIGTKLKGTSVIQSALMMSQSHALFLLTWMPPPQRIKNI